MENALIAMSGGVDSSAAAAIMRRDGFHCIGATMRLYDKQTSNECIEQDDLINDHVADAKAAAERLGMQFYVFDFRDEFEKKVINRFISAYERGETPNPCIDCNRYLKFDQFYQKAKELDIDIVATGHYARIEYASDEKRWRLRKARNHEKDQSYVLYALTQEQLAHTRFPLGEYESKEQVRAMAEECGFVNARKRDSQDICFVPDKDYAAFIQAYTGKEYAPGDFVDENGTVLGRHKGMIHYTIGQRRGLGLSLKSPLYVCRKCMEDNVVVLTEDEGLYSSELTAKDFNWIIKAPTEQIRVKAKTRYRAKEADAIAKICEDGQVKVVFEQPQRAIAKGQAVVLYDGEYVVGGGTIC